jgi:hypothetical protein
MSVVAVMTIKTILILLEERLEERRGDSPDCHQETRGEVCRWHDGKSLLSSPTCHQERRGREGLQDSRMAGLSSPLLSCPLVHKEEGMHSLRQTIITTSPLLSSKALVDSSSKVLKFL